MKKQLKPLEPGTEVAIANCRETGRVVARVAKNIYRVSWNGQEFETTRAQLCVKVGGIWKSARDNG